MNPQDSSPPRPRALIESALASAVDRVGPVLFFDPDRLRSLLRQATTEAPVEVDLLLGALTEEVPQHLLAANGDEEIHALLPRLVQRVAQNRRVERGPATWAVRTWAHALALPTTGLEGAARAAPVEAPTPPDLSAVLRPRAEATNRRPPVPVPFPAPTRSASPPVVPPARAGVAPIVPADVAPIAAITPPRDVPDQSGFDPADALSEFVPLDEPARVDDVIATPVPDLVPGTTGAEANAIMAASLEPTPMREPVFAPEREPFDEPMRALRAPVAPQPGLLRPRNLALAALIVVVIAAAIGYALWPSILPTATSSSSAAGKVAMPSSTTAPEKPAAPEPSPAPPASSAPPPPVEATPSPGPTPTPVASAITPPVEAKVEPPAALPPTETASTTAAAPTITRIDVPTAVVGKPFSVALAVDGDPRRVASVERRVIESDTTWPSETMTHGVSALARTKSGGFMLPFRPVDRASTSTIQFTAIDRNGARGPARRVTLKVANDAPPVVAAAAAAAAVDAAEAPCAPSTCGSVVSLREIELRTGATSYETIVRMDDRSIQNVAQPTRWTLGQRVKMIGSRFITIDN